MNRKLTVDEIRRKELLNIEGDYRSGGTEHFSNLSVDTLKILIDENFIHLGECQNCSPSTEDFYNFLLKYPFFKAYGYAVSPERYDYRITIEGIEGIPMIDKDIIAFADFAKNADVLQCHDTKCYCWWD